MGRYGFDPCGFFGFRLRFSSVTGFFKPAPSLKPHPKPKILAAHRYNFSINALKPNAGFDGSRHFNGYQILPARILHRGDAKFINHGWTRINTDNNFAGWRSATH